MSDLDKELRAIIQDKPWLDPGLAIGSWWMVTSEVSKAICLGHDGTPAHSLTLVDVLCTVSIEDSGFPIFIVCQPWGQVAIVKPGYVTTAVRVHMVRDDDPTRTIDRRGQEAFLEALRRAAS